MFAGIHVDTVPRPWSEEECRAFESGTVYECSDYLCHQLDIGLSC